MTARGEQELSDLTPERVFVAADPVERAAAVTVHTGLKCKDPRGRIVASGPAVLDGEALASPSQGFYPHDGPT